MKKVYITIIGLSCLAGSAFAAVIVQPTTFTSVGSIQGGSIDNTINGFGLSGALNTGDAVPGTLPTDSGASFTTGVRWFVSDAQTQHISDITFNLGGEYDLESVLFWNYDEDGNTDRGIKSVTASFSSDGLSFTGDTTLNFAEASGSLPIAGETVSMVASDVQYVKFTNFADHADGGTLIGFSEIRFAAIPEPATASMLLGLGASLMVFLRRRLH